VHRLLPDDPEVTGLLALMVLTDARRPARAGSDGTLIPMAEQDRTRWDADLIAEGVALISSALPRGAAGPYQLQAAIAAVHDEAPSAADTDWPQIVALYEVLLSGTDNPVVALNHAVAVAMVHGPADGLARVDRLAAELRHDHRWHAVQGHLLALAGDQVAARSAFEAAAQRTMSLQQKRYLLRRAAAMSEADGS
jgi:predicted RNA polymerase sigma factor